MGKEPKTKSKIRIVFIVLVLLFLTALCLQSTTWFRLKLAESYEKKGMEKELIEMYEKILRKDEVKVNNPLVFRHALSENEKYDMVTAVAEYYYGRDLNKSIKFYKDAKKLKPDSESNYTNLYRLYISREDFYEAAYIYTRYIKYFKREFPLKSPVTPEWYYQLGLNSIRQGLLEKAELSFRELLEQGVESSDIYYRLSEAYIKEDNMDKAMNLLKKAIVIQPDHLNALESLQKIYLDEKNREGYYKIGAWIEGAKARSCEAKPYNSYEPVGLWRFDEGKGNIARDSFGKSNGRIHEAKWIEGIAGYALDFSGTGEYIEISDEGMRWDANNFKVSFWILPKDMASFQGLVGDRGKWQVIINKNRFGFWVRQKEGDNETLYSEKTFSPYRWYQVSVSYQEGEARLYVDNSLENKISGLYEFSREPGPSLIIGGQWRKSRYVNAILDSLLIECRRKNN